VKAAREIRWYKYESQIEADWFNCNNIPMLATAQLTTMCHLVWIQNSRNSSA